MQIATKLDLIQNSDAAELEAIAQSVVLKHSEKVAAYKSGKTGLMGLFIGEAMKLSGGKADPKLLQSIMNRLLNQ